MGDNNLAKKILSLCDNNVLSGDIQALSADIMHAFLAMGSETDDNINCYHHIEYGEVSERDSTIKSAYGLKVKGKSLLVSEVMNAVEDLPIPEPIKEYFPDLTEQEWQAVTRITTMVLLSLECIR
ncbi:MAG: hypothetical protein ACJ8CR_28275 [Roseiflexaceae bacterium]